MKIFCEGVGEDKADITGASRAMKKSEYKPCQKNGVKSITQALVGILVRQGRLDVHERVDVPEWADDDPRSQITVDQMLRMVDALKFHEEHGEVCPAGWQEGKAGMKADAEGVASYLSDNAESL